LYQVVLVFKSSEEAAKLEPLQKRLLQSYEKSLVRNGAALDEEQRKVFAQVSERLSSLSVKFLQNANEDTSHLIFTKDELEGINEALCN
jgi:Zn-dependent oligopeptidase